ncbi:MAG: hypothetical protein UT43_C0005G0021 [Parcubacteria group bacterium GW2011_GWC1_39_29]|nr:MAG: hypothetical protein UT43_C0005G0021 [Parcubacteria group bacterium GW2011_GWC1_39_29]
MATTAKLNSQGNYEIFKDGQRVATGTESVLSQYGLSPTSLTNEAITPSGQKVNPVTGQIITSDMLGQSPTPFVSPQVPAPSDISGLPIGEMKLTPQEEAQTSLEKQMADLALSISGKPAFEAEKRKEFGTEAAQQAYDDLNTQLRDLQRQQQLVPLAIQREAEGRGRTEGGVEPLEIGKRRALAYDALTTSSLIDAAQGRLASAERKVTEAVNNKFAPDEAKYAALLNNLNLIKNSPQTSVEDKNRAIKQEEIIKARQEANNKAKEEAKNILSWANKAAENMAKQGSLDTVILNKIANSKTESEAFSLAAPFLAVPKAETGDIAKFKIFFPTADLATPEGQKLYFDWKAKGEEPTFDTFERVVNGEKHTIRQTLDPTGRVISETDLGAKEAKPIISEASDKALTGEFGDIIKSASNLVGVEKGKTSKAAMAEYIANNDFVSAYAQVANNVEESLTGEVKTKFANARIDYGVMQGLRDTIQKFADAGGNMGYLKGTADEIARKFGQLKTDPKFASLAVQLTREFQMYRVVMTGAAFSPEESREYKAVNPRTNASLDLNLATIDGALNQLENRITATVNTKIPNASKLYEKVGGDGMSDDDAYNEYLKLTKQSSGQSSGQK